MAISRLGHIKENKKGNPNKGIIYCIDYIFNPEKTENYKYVGAHNIVLDRNDRTQSAYRQFMCTKNSFGKTLGRQAYHYKLSFATQDNITAELAMQITKEFCEQYLNSYDTVYSVHTNTAHIHSHIVFNSVAYDTGLKYYYKNGDWRKYIQPIVNELCIKYNLSYIDLNTESKVKFRTYADWLKANPQEKKDNVTYYSWDRIRQDIDECIYKAHTYNEFKNMMSLLGYTLNDEGKYLRIFAPGRKKAVRAYVLSPDRCTYTLDNIKKMITGEYKSADRRAVIDKMLSDFNIFLKTRHVDIITKRYKNNIAFAQSEEAMHMVIEHGFKDNDDVMNYISYINQADRELNIIKKIAEYHIAKYHTYSKPMDELISLLPYVKEHRLYNNHINEYNRALDIIDEIKSKGNSAAKLYCNYKLSVRLLENVTQFKKKLFVNKKISERIIRNNTVNNINKITGKSRRDI